MLLNISLAKGRLFVFLFCYCCVVVVFMGNAIYLELVPQFPHKMTLKHTVCFRDMSLRHVLKLSFCVERHQALLKLNTLDEQLGFFSLYAVKKKKKSNQLE